MSKALGFTKDQLDVNTLHPLGISSAPGQIFDFKYELLSRPECETMYDYLHLIPYITVVDKNSGEIFVYSRGKAGGESRLHGNCSIGLGGHMEEELTETYTIKDAIVECIARELEEEVGLKPTEEAKQVYRRNLDTGNFNIIYDPSNDVGKVHLGLTMFVVVEREHFGEVEHGVIERGQWMKTEDLINANENMEVALENWSLIVLEVVKHTLAQNKEA